jgi:hypothetical protein
METGFDMRLGYSHQGGYGKPRRDRGAFIDTWLVAGGQRRSAYLMGSAL